MRADNVIQKSELIREEKHRNPRARAPAIRAALAKQGVEVELSYVRLILSRMQRIKGYDREARRRRLGQSLGTTAEVISRLLERAPAMTPLALREELSRRGLRVTTHVIKQVRRNWRRDLQGKNKQVTMSSKTRRLIRPTPHR